MTKDRSAKLHVEFSWTGGQELRKALKQLGHTDNVIAFDDNFSWGPINPPDRERRSRFAPDELGLDFWNEIGSNMGAFWERLRQTNGPLVAWVSRRSARECANFFEFVWRLGGTACEIVDLTDTILKYRHLGETCETADPVLSISHLHADEIVQNDLFAAASGLDKQDRERYRAIWGTLREENAPLRVLDDKLRLLSAPMTYFDEKLLSFVGDRWVKTARIVGHTMASFWDVPVSQADSMVFEARIKALADAGVIELNGNWSDPTSSEVRLPVRP